MKFKDIFKKESCWTCGAAARDKFGSVVEYMSSEATCWCLGGAAEKYRVENSATKEEMEEIRFIMNDFAVRNCSYGGFVVFNDAVDTTWEDIKNLVEELTAAGF